MRLAMDGLFIVDPVYLSAISRFSDFMRESGEC
jgi:hypothetical protein